MKTKLILTFTAVLLISGFLPRTTAFSQSEKGIVKKYLQELPVGRPDFKEGPQNYRMTAIYINRDLYGNFTGKSKVSGEYTCGLENGMASWTDVKIAASDDFSAPFSEGKKQKYMEDFNYLPSPEMLNEEAFRDFPAGPDNVLARNLIWDMSTIEEFAWNYSDSLKLNIKYTIPDIAGEFAMAGIGTYDHASIQLCWTGISYINDELCYVIEYMATDNKIELSMDPIQSKGTEQYWGTTWVSFKTLQIEYAEMYGGTIQEIEVKGMKDKIIAKTIRELWVERIK